MAARRVDEQLWNQVERVLASEVQLAVAVTGGGSELAAWLLDHPGASRAVVEIQIPYHAGALRDYLGAPGPHRVASKTAVHLAGRAFVRARQLAGGSRPIGLGCTAALATRRVRKGEDRAWVAVRLDREYRLYELRFARGAAGRLEQEEILSRLALAALDAACCVAPWQEQEWPAHLEWSARVLSLEDPLELALRDDLEVLEMDREGRVSAEVERRDRLLFPGSFNPLHQGHARLAEAAQRLSGRQVCMELSVANVDKPPLPRPEVERRVAQFRGRYPVVLTRAPTFLEKARLFGNCTFVIGYDTAARLFEPRYYQDSAAEMEKALAEMAAADCHFLVAGRLCQEQYRTLDDLELPAAHRRMFTPIPEAVFRLDISSSAIRAGRGPSTAP
jgi:hypothetical protein